jgi:hypothetical protein
VKLFAALVLFVFWAANVVVGTIGLAAQTPVHDRSAIKAHQFLRHIFPQERTC